jgi:alkaline phosphatase isozyme conversion protein
MYVSRGDNCMRHSPNYGLFPIGRNSVKRTALLMSFVLILPILLGGCGKDDTVETPIAEYGTYGSDIAIELARQYPYRKAYSAEEKSAGEYVKSEFEKLGFTVTEQTFSSPDQSGTSANYIVKIPGQGFMMAAEDGSYKEEHRQVIVGAHYDTVFGTSNSAANPDYNGIQDNASGIGCLLTLAKQLKGTSNGYDVILVAFGAGEDSAAGAAYYESQMTLDEISSTDAMYCIESIYAGDKLYASAGWNSLASGMKYEMRRKLYEAYDVVYENSLSSKNGVDLLYNESGLSIDVNGDGTADIYREVTLNQSDYVPFDNAGIPIVFLESYDYNYAAVEEMKETKNLNLQTAAGMIRHTDLDSIDLLAASLDEGQLEKRINNTAFILLKCIEKGVHNGLLKSAYEAGETLVPTIHVEVTVTPAAQASQNLKG